MHALTETKLLMVLLALLALTLSSWLFTHFGIVGGKQLGLVILGLAFIKVRLIVIHYMEATEVLLPIRLAFETWILLAALGTMLIYAM